jgi:hypothetical protein
MGRLSDVADRAAAAAEGIDKRQLLAYNVRRTVHAIPH